VSKEVKIPQWIAAFIKATNAHNTHEFLSTLTDSAVIADEGQEYRGIAAIKAWSDEKYIGAKVTLDVVEVVNSNGKTTVTVKVDGNFDKTGLPDPFVMDLHFVVDGEKIARLSFHLVGE
jgi:hypothetical protein